MKRPGFPLAIMATVMWVLSAFLAGQVGVSEGFINVWLGIASLFLLIAGLISAITAVCEYIES